MSLSEIKARHAAATEGVGCAGCHNEPYESSCCCPAAREHYLATKAHRQDVETLLALVERARESLDELLEAAYDEVRPIPAIIKTAKALLAELEG